MRRTFCGRPFNQHLNTHVHPWSVRTAGGAPTVVATARDGPSDRLRSSLGFDLQQTRRRVGEP